MNSDSFDLATLAKYLQRDARELDKLADKGRLPAKKVGGEWRFNRTEINQWLETQLPQWSDQQLEVVELGMHGPATERGALELLISRLLTPATIAVPLEARTAPGVLQRLVEVANGTWQVYMTAEVLEAIRARESLLSTALPGGVAIPHPRRPMPEALGESVLAFGRTLSGIPFGGPRGQLTDLFFLVLCRTDREHLQVLARLSRMFQREGFLDRLREAEDAAGVLAAVEECEHEVLG